MRNVQEHEKSLLPLLTVIAVVVAPLLFILGLAFGANFGNREGFIGGSISDWLTATATVAVTALTFVSRVRHQTAIFRGFLTPVHCKSTS